MISSQMNAVVSPTVSRSSNSSKIKTKPSLLPYRFMVFYRFALALIGGYILASLSAIVIAQIFEAHRSSAAMSATLIAFSLHCGAFIWVFMINKTLKASLGIIIPSIILFIIYKCLGN